MKIYKDGCHGITLKGVVYYADEHGIIEVPDNKMNSSVWTQGFVSAQGRLDELEAAAADETAAIEIEPVQPALIDKTPAATAKAADKADGKTTTPH